MNTYRFSKGNSEAELYRELKRAVKKRENSIRFSTTGLNKNWLWASQLKSEIDGLNFALWTMEAMGVGHKKDKEGECVE